MRASLDGQVLSVDSGVSWSISTGTSAYVMSIEVDYNAAARLWEEGGHGTSVLSIENDSGIEVRIQGLTILGTGPTSSPHTLTLSVADGRWWWPRVWVKRSYNIRRKTGRTKKLPNSNDDIGNLQLDEDYHEWSLHPSGQPWTARQVIEDVVGAVVFTHGDEYKIYLDGVDFPPVEGIEIDSPGDVAIGRVLAILGGKAMIYQSAEGYPVIRNAFDGGERKLVGLPVEGQTATSGSSIPAVHGYPVWDVQNKAMERPSSVRVLFTRAIELRFDADEKSTKKGGTKNLADLKAENVLPLPEDAVIGTSGEALKFGSWVRLEDYVTYLGTLNTPSNLPKITLDLINKAWLHSALEVYGMLDPSGLWARRISAVRSHYRRTYRIARPYSERVREFWARRVKLQDAESNGFLSAPCWFDYAAYTTWRATDANKAADGPEPAKTVVNRFANPFGGPNDIIEWDLDVLEQTPANVNMVDPELGIFTIEFFPDMAAKAINYIHSALVTVPTDDPKEDDTWLQDGHLYRDREFSCLLTTTPQAPNDSRQLYGVRVTEQDVLGTSSTALGHEITIHVDPNVAMARFEWDDNRSEKVKAWFKQASNPTELDFGNPEGDLETFGEPLNATELMAVARVKATEIYTRYIDRVEGGLTTDLSNVNPRGTVSAIRHEASKDGALTTVSMPPEPPDLDLSNYMPASVRRLIDRSGEA